MLITFNSMGYDYISKICFDFLKRIIPHTSSASMFSCSLTLFSAFRLKILKPLHRVSRQWRHIFRTHSSQQVI